MEFFDNEQFLYKLLSLDTSTGQSANQRQALDIIGSAIPSDFQYESFVNHGKVSGYWYPAGSLNVDILISGHIDVIPAERSMFRPRQEGDKLYARGAFDMKGPLVASIEAMCRYANTSPQLSIGLLVTSDEEQGGRAGTKVFLARYPDVRPRLVVVPDGGNDFSIVIEQKGVMNIELTFSGQPAHAARPWEGDNPVRLASAAIQKISQHYPHGTPADWKTTITVSGVEAGGAAYNVVPSQAKVRLDVRNIAADDQQKIITFCKKLVTSGKCTVKIKEPALRVTAGKKLKLFKEIVRNELDREPILERYPAASDARYFTDRSEAILVTRPLGGGAHSDKEWVSMKGLDDFSRVLTMYFHRLQSLP